MRPGAVGRLRCITAVSFDVDMTLWDFRATMRRALGMTLDLLRQRAPGPASQVMTIDRMIAIRDAVAEAPGNRGARLEDVRLLAFARTVEMVGSADPELALEMNTLYRACRWDIELYPDVVPVLDALAPHYPLGLLSNGNTYPDTCDLSGRFSFTAFAQDLGVEKPDPAFFVRACRQAGCEPDRLLHIGDSLECDVQGAKGVGAVSIWLNRDGAPNGTGIRPDYEIRSLVEVVDLLAL